MTDLPAPSASEAADKNQASEAAASAAAAVTPPKKAKRRASDKTGSRRGGRLGGCFAALLNLLALLLLVLTVAVAALVVLLFRSPGVLAYVPGGSAYMVPTDPAVAEILFTPAATTAASGPGFPTLPPVWTPADTPTISPTPLPSTDTPIPTSTTGVGTYTPSPTASPSATATRPPATATRSGPTPKPTVTRAAYVYTLQAGSPTYLANYINTSGCNWFGIVGRAFGLDNNPVINLTVHLEGGGISADTVTGSGPAALGPGSYVFPIADHPIQTTGTYQIQLRNNTGTPLSDVYAISTYGDCTKNLVMVNFVQNH
jgi:hypothetical protein